MYEPDKYQRLKSFHNVKPAFDGIWTFIRVTLSSLTLLTCLGVCILTMLVLIPLSRVPNLSVLEHYNPGTAISLYDINNNLICTFPEKEKRELVSLADISPNLTRAVLAQEDHYFYEHHGVSAEGVLRACWANLTAGRQVQGGSTLTQQLVKNIFFPEEARTIPLKLAEGLVASQIEQRYSKERILEIYLNQIYFGQGAYGCEQAAKTYFGKSSRDLSIAESAFLAALIKSPAILGDESHRLTTLKHQKSVIKKMLEYDMITKYDAWMAEHQQLVFKRAEPSKSMKQFVPKYPYYSTYVAQLVESKFNFGRHKSLKVYCNLDPEAQRAAEQTLNQYKGRLPAGLDQAALVSIRLNDGAVVAMVGGIGGYLDNQWNSAVHPHTMGSAFKPFVYLTAFEHRIFTPSSQISDAPLSVLDQGDDVWEPSNFDGKYMGLITVEQALAYSRNVCSVRVAQQTGIPPIIDTARRAGISEPLAPTLALSLGCSAASPLTLACAYSTLARGGIYMPPHVLRKIEDERGHELWREEESHGMRALDAEATIQIVEILKKVVQGGTGTHARLNGIACAGKTGTANDAKDLWFVGFTPNLVTAVWTGNSENKSVKGHNVTGGTIAAVMWRKYNQEYYTTHEKPHETLIASDNSKLDPLKSVDQKKSMEPIIASPDMQAIIDAQNAPHPRTARPRATRPTIKKGSGVTEYSWSSLRADTPKLDTRNSENPH